jgi:hypothetical protein
MYCTKSALADASILESHIYNYSAMKKAKQETTHRIYSTYPISSESSPSSHRLASKLLCQNLCQDELLARLLDRILFTSCRVLPQVSTVIPSRSIEHVKCHVALSLRVTMAFSLPEDGRLRCLHDLTLSY